MIGCGQNAKNKLTVNYLYLAEKHGAVVHELHEVHEVTPLEGGGFEVVARHPGLIGRAEHRHHHTAEHVIVSAHAYGSAKLLHHLKHTGTLPGLSDQLGQRARTNSEQLILITRPYGKWKHDPEQLHITPGSVSITSGVWPDPETSIEQVDVDGVERQDFHLVACLIGLWLVPAPAYDDDPGEAPRARALDGLVDLVEIRLHHRPVDPAILIGIGHVNDSGEERDLVAEAADAGERLGPDGGAVIGIAQRQHVNVAGELLGHDQGEINCLGAAVGEMHHPVMAPGH